MKRIVALFVIILLSTAALLAGNSLTLKDVAHGTFRTQSMAAVQPAQDGESYLQISADGQCIEQYSFKTGQQTGTLLDLATVRGPKVRSIDGYVMSPDGQRLLVQTETEYIYRHSFTAKYYIYDVRNQKMEPLSDGGPQQSPLFSPDGQLIAFVRDNNIFLVKLLYNNAESQVTKDGKRNEVINGIPDWVYEEEFSTSFNQGVRGSSPRWITLLNLYMIH